MQAKKFKTNDQVITVLAAANFTPQIQCFLQSFIIFLYEILNLIKIFNKIERFMNGNFLEFDTIGRNLIPALQL